jgi:hypothetical protein
MATLVTEILNMSLSRIGSKRLAYSGTTETDLDANTTLEAILCNLQYEQTRDSVLRSHWWRFASTRAVLALDTETPSSEWDYQFILPEDFLRMKSIYEDRFSDANLDSYALEGTFLLTNESSMSIRYIRKVTDVTEFDPLFIEVLVLHLALKLIPALAGTKSEALTLDVKQDLKNLTSQVRAIDRQETNTIGQYGLETWNDARY